MKLELIQPFINAADAVLAQTLACQTRVSNVSMEQEVYRRRGVAAIVTMKGDIEGRIVFDLETETAARIASALAGSDLPQDAGMVHETICELANQVIGNAITCLNDQGFHFRVQPPEVHTAERGIGNSEDTEALVMCFDTPSGSVFMNIALRFPRFDA
ncbi:MAG: chemotaxis protein CheX [Acidobacteriia bacterium]|nr:chemotaxis protein CheX [Terriglobia bacterium]